jgi:hypothetical protein
MKCVIKWVDAQGEPTPDDNDAAVMVRLPLRVEQHNGRTLTLHATKWFPCCAEHAKRLRDPAMHAWECRPLDAIEETFR